MKPPRLRSSISVLLLSSVFSFGGHAQVDWQQEALLLLNSVSPNLNDLRSQSTGNVRLGRYAEGLAAFSKNGILPPNPREAGKIFQELLDIRSNDAIGLASRYYLIQVESLLEPDFDAKESYRSFFEDHPETFFGGLSLVKYAILEAYADEDKADALRRLLILERLGANLEIPDVLRDFRRVLGDAYLAFELSDERAYEHLKEAVKIGSTIENLQADLLIKTGELAERLGLTSEAANFYASFCEEIRGDPRKGDIEKRLARLTQSAN